VIVHLDKPGAMAEEERVVSDAFRSHFTRQSQLASQELRSLLGRGWISLAIGLCFLAAMITIAEPVATWIGADPFATILRESLIIGGWVAMWRPLEIFLYDWWPIVGRRRIFDRLSRVPVRILYTAR
jgi:hypothetical protein